LIKRLIIILISIAFSFIGQCQSWQDSLIVEGNRYFDKSHDFWDLSNLDSCFYYTAKALNSFKQAESSDNVIMCYNGLSSVSGYQGKFLKQIEYLDSALLYINQDSITINAVEANYNYASYLESINLLEAAEKRYLLTSKFAEDISLDNLILHTLHNNISYLFLKSKNYKSAIDEIEIAIELIKNEKNTSFYHVRSLISKANIYSEINNYEEAFEALELAEKVSNQGKKEDRSQLKNEILLEKAKIFFKTLQFAQCLDILDLCDAKKLKKTPTVYFKFLRLRILSKMKLTSPLIGESNEYLDALFEYPKRNIDYIQEYLGELALTNVRKGLISETKANIQKLTDETSKFKNELQTTNIAFQKATLTQCAYELKIGSKIETFYNNDQLNDICINLLNAAHQLRRISYYSNVKTEWSEKIEELLPYILILSSGQKISDNIIINVSELIKQRNANERSALLKKAKDSELFSDIKRKEALIAKYEEHQLVNTDKKEIEENRLTLSKLRQELSYKFQLLKKQLPDLYEKVYLDHNVTISEIQKLLNHDQVVLNYLEFEQYLCVCSIEKDKSECKTIENQNLSADIKKLLSLLENENSKRSKYKSLSNKVYQQLLSPHLKLNTKKVIIIPHGLLSFLPFHALVNNEGNFTLSDYTFNYQLNLNLLLATSNREQSKIDGINVFQSLSTNENSLICGEKEISNITQAKVNINSNLHQLLTQNESSKILHVIAHASSNNENLSGEISEGKSMLSGLRIKNGNIKSDLIILSSCESSVGINTRGEGVSSLNSAIFHNDIGASISSLWKIDDCSTAEILSTFYKNISSHSKDESLRIAMLDFIAKAHPTRRHPHFWAGLVQYGNTNNVRFKSSSNYNFITLIILSFVFFSTILLLFKRKLNTKKHSA